MNINGTIKKFVENTNLLFRIILSGAAVSTLAIGLLWLMLAPRIEASIKASEDRQTSVRDSLLNLQKGKIETVAVGVDSLRRAARFQKNFARFANPTAYQRAIKESQDWQ